MIRNCLICGKRVYDELTTETACPGLHKQLVDKYGFYDKKGFSLSRKGELLLKKMTKK